MKRLLITLCIVAVALISGLASAQTPAVLRPGTHPFWGAFGLGPAIGVDNYTGTQFKLLQEFGYHFSGTAEGPALAFDLQESFGDSVTMIQVGGKFIYDIQPVPDLGLYLGPSILMGLTHWSVSLPPCTDIYPGFCDQFQAPGGNFFNIQIGFEGKLVLGDRGMVFFRPFTLDINANSDTTFVRYDLIFGGGVIF